MAEDVNSNTNTENVPEKKTVAIFSQRTTVQNIVTAEVLDHYGYSVYSINLNNETEWVCPMERGNMPVFSAAKLLPKSVCGFCRNTLTVIRTIYAAARTVIWPQKSPKASIIFCETDSIAIPILRLRYRVVAFTTYVKTPPTLLEKLSLYCADEVVTPNSLTRYIVKQYFPKLKKRLTIICPPIILDAFRSNTHALYGFSEKCALFVAVGNYVKDSHLMQILEAFHILRTSGGMDSIRVLNTHCIVIPTCEFRKEYYSYYNKLYDYVLENNLTPNFTLMKSLPGGARKSILQKSLAIIYAAHNEPYNQLILEAMSLGKPVVACRQPLTELIVQDNVTGFLLACDEELFASHMRELLVYPDIAENMKGSIIDEFEKNYGFASFSVRLNKIVCKIDWKMRQKEDENAHDSECELDHESGGDTPRSRSVKEKNKDCGYQLNESNIFQTLKLYSSSSSNEEDMQKVFPRRKRAFKKKYRQSRGSIQVIKVDSSETTHSTKSEDDIYHDTYQSPSLIKKSYSMKSTSKTRASKIVQHTKSRNILNCREQHTASPESELSEDSSAKSTKYFSDFKRLLKTRRRRAKERKVKFHNKLINTEEKLSRNILTCREQHTAYPESELSDDSSAKSAKYFADLKRLLETLPRRAKIRKVKFHNKLINIGEKISGSSSLQHTETQHFTSLCTGNKSRSKSPIIDYASDSNDSAITPVKIFVGHKHLSKTLLDAGQKISHSFLLYRKSDESQNESTTTDNTSSDEDYLTAEGSQICNSQNESGDRSAESKSDLSNVTDDNEQSDYRSAESEFDWSNVTDENEQHILNEEGWKRNSEKFNILDNEIETIVLNTDEISTDSENYEPMEKTLYNLGEELVGNEETASLISLTVSEEDMQSKRRLYTIEEEPEEYEESFVAPVLQVSLPKNVVFNAHNQVSVSLALCMTDSDELLRIKVKLNISDAVN